MVASPFRLRHAARVLRAGGLVAHPTEGVWGVACDPFQVRAVQRLLEAKRRDPDKGLILVAENSDKLSAFVSDQVCDDARERAESSWPGPHTWIFPAATAVPWWIRGRHAGVALRVSAHPLVRALCQAFGGALVSSSANISGRTAAVNAWQVRAQLGSHFDFLLSGALQTPGQPSTIHDAASGASLRGSFGHAG